MEIYARRLKLAYTDVANLTKPISVVGGEGAYLLLGVGPAGDLNNHVQDALLLIGIKGNIVEGRDRDAILLDVHPVLQGVGLANLADREGHVVSRMWWMLRGISRRKVIRD